VVALSKAADVPVAVDPKRKNFLSYGGVHLFKPNLKELREGLKLDADLSELSELEAAVKTLHEGYDIGLVLVTLSDKGVFLSGRNRRGGYHQRLIPAHVRSIADVSGAGDTVIGTAAMCLAAGASDELMAALCNLAGGLVCEQVGVVPVDKHKLMDEAIRYFT
jgi:bifunctional ADP-heptose synthase (sugar kinase/adenylyltransferase)